MLILKKNALILKRKKVTEKQLGSTGIKSFRKIRTVLREY